MLKMHENFTKQNCTIVTYGCSAHYINILEEQITAKEAIKDIVEVHKCSRNHHQPHAWLEEKDCVTSQIPNANRWNSNLKNISRILNSVSVYKEYVHLNRESSHFKLMR